MGEVIHFPGAQQTRRVDELCKALANCSGPRELIEHEVHAGAVCIRVAHLELWLTPEELEELAEDARELARTLGVERG